MELYLSIASSILGIISVFLAIKKESQKIKTILVITSLFIFLLSGLSAFALIENNRLKSPQYKVKAFLEQWESKNIEFISNGQLKGAMIEGMIVLESMRDQMPDNYEKAKEFVYKGHDPRVDQEFWDERNKLKDGFEAMVSIMKGLKLL